MEIIGFMLLSLLIISFTVVVGFLLMVFKKYTQDDKPIQKPDDDAQEKYLAELSRKKKEKGNRKRKK